MKIRITIVALFVVIISIFYITYNQVLAIPTVSTAEITSENKLLSKYTKYVEYCIRLSMRNANITGRHKFSMQFNVEKDGKISAYDILNTSDSQEYDKRVIQAVVNTAPFKPFPVGLNKPAIGYQVHFNGGDISIGSYANPQRLTYSVNQQNKSCKTVNIDEAKSVRTMSQIPSYISHQIHHSMAQQVQGNWYPPLNENSAVGITFRINKNGSVDNIRVFKSSYNNAADNAALYAIKSLKLPVWTSSNNEATADVKYWFYVENARY